MKRNYAFNITLSHLFFMGCLIFMGCLNSKKGDDKLTGNTVYVRLTGEPERLNPLTTEDANALQVMSQIFLPLLDLDPQTHELVPVLAKNRAVITKIDTGLLKGGTAYSYEIRDDARWTDGSAVLATDVLFTVKAILNKKSGANNLRTSIDFIQDVLLDAGNPKKITILSHISYILAETNVGTLPILPEKVYDTEGVLHRVSVRDLVIAGRDTTVKIEAAAAIAQFATNLQQPKFSREPTGIIGSGAYSLAEWTSGERIILQKKSNWWGDKLAATMPLFAALPDQLYFKIVPDETASLALVKDGKLDVVTKLAPKQFLEMQKDVKMTNLYNFHAVPTLNLAVIGINCKSPFLTDKRTRRALAHLVNTDYLMKTIMNGFAQPCAGPFLSQKTYYDSTLTNPEFDVEKAKKLLAKVGWVSKGGNDSMLYKQVNGQQKPLVLRYCCVAANGMAKNIGLILQENARKIGVKIEIVPVEGKAFFDVLKKRDFDLFLNSMGMSPTLDDPKELWATSSNTPDGSNRFQFENKNADILMDKIRAELNETKRNALYKDFQKLIYDEQPAIFLFSPKDRIVISNRFEALSVSRRPGYVLGQFKLK